MSKSNQESSSDEVLSQKVIWECSVTLQSSTSIDEGNDENPELLREKSQGKYLMLK
jgi:hypothetical protein